MEQAFDDILQHAKSTRKSVLLGFIQSIFDSLCLAVSVKMKKKKKKREKKVGGGGMQMTNYD